MSNPHYTIRNYQSADFDKFVLLSVEAEKPELTGRYVSPQVIAERLGRPNYSPGQDLFLVEIAGDVIGYIDMAPELAIKRVILDCWIHPEHRRKGLATKLFSHATHYAKELGAKAAHVNIPQDSVIAKSVLPKLGFERIERFLELRLEIARIPWQSIDQATLGCCHLQRGEEDKLTRIQNRCFAGTWGYNPDTLQEITYRANLSSRSPDDVILIYQGNEVIGYCWTEVTNNEETDGTRTGRISMIGTDPDYRGRGAGRRVLLAGLAHLKSKGVRVTDLTVDSENKVACALYRSVGFEVQTSSLWYEKVID
ncbi:GNAT family N-acetyltransferase [Chloroflexota bacterium]